MAKITYPNGLKESGKALYKSIVTVYDLSVSEKQTLTEACRAVDRLDLLASELEKDPFNKSLMVETRLLSAHKVRLITALRLPEVLEDERVYRPQRRGGYRNGNRR
ncbi:hypothetical protein [Antrihabitans sp. YC2-6]|uniref:hypothetical protein n=1 Tax=Antrihabitans sp. YC2-6 TaxID=2799498 RepID=UPI0018F31A83|nr:hypothetical protein [Antrihabitans sp. YC2-6]MBJ8348577.1 hypothetical protein [Antrihabitans sp. YC2-6]